MDVNCVVFGPLRDATGGKELSLSLESDTTVRTVLETLERENPALEGKLLTDDGAIRGGIVVTLNKRHVNQLDGPTTSVPEDATVRITPSVQGG